MLLDVACALILDGHKIFAAQRALHKSNANLWEFPGGKIEPGEDAATAIIREMKEELNLVVSPTRPFESTTVETQFVRLHPWYCKIHTGTPVLRDHQRYQWISIQNWDQYKWTPPDIQILKMLTLKH